MYRRTEKGQQCSIFAFTENGMYMALRLSRYTPKLVSKTLSVLCVFNNMVVKVQYL
jgi:hypothetical protein